jgi:hypothetical protein
MLLHARKCKKMLTGKPWNEVSSHGVEIETFIRKNEATLETKA